MTTVTAAAMEALQDQLAKAPAGVIVKTYRAEAVKAVDEDRGEVQVTLSTSKIDRDREVILPEGMIVGKPKHLPLIAAHDYRDLRKQIGDILKVSPQEGGVDAHLRYFVGLGNQEADWAFTLVKLGVAAYSIGFQPIEWEDANLADEKVLAAVLAGKRPLRTHKRWELVEGSQVIVPSNRGALQKLVAKGLLQTEEIDRVLVAATVGEMADRLERKAADPPAGSSGDAEGLGLGLDDEAPGTLKQEASWRVGGARGLPLVDDDAWDGDAADAALRRFCGGPEKEGMNWTRYRRGHVFYNGSDRESFGGYKMVFVKIEGGRMVASRKGLIACRVVLSGGRQGINVPENIKAAGTRFVDSYLGAPEKGEDLPVPTVAVLRLGVEPIVQADAVEVRSEEDRVLFRGALMDLEERLSMTEAQLAVRVEVRAEEAVAALEAWRKTFEVQVDGMITEMAATIAHSVPKAPAFPPDSAANLTLKELAAQVVEAASAIAQKVAEAVIRGEIGKLVGDVDAYRRS